MVGNPPPFLEFSFFDFCLLSYPPTLGAKLWGDLDGRMDGGRDRQMDGHRDLDGRTNRRMDGQKVLDGRTNGQTNSLVAARRTRCPRRGLRNRPE